MACIRFDNTDIVLYKIYMNSKKQYNKESETSYTAWHIYLAESLEYLIKPEDMQLFPFDKLGTLPLESDFIIIRKKKRKNLAQKYPDLNFLIPYLGKYTVIEYKSPLDRLTYDDFDTVRAYMLLAKKKYKITYDNEVNIISMASSFQEGYSGHIKLNGFTYKKIKEGIYGHINDKGQSVYWINLEETGKKDPGNFINIFSSNYKLYEKVDPKSVIRNYDLFSHTFRSIFFNKERIMNNVAIKYKKEFTEDIDKIAAKFLDSFPAEYRVRGLRPEDRLAGLRPEDRLAGLRPEDRLAGLRPEDRLAGLRPEDRLAGLRPEDRLAGLQPEDRKKLLELLTQCGK